MNKISFEPEQLSQVVNSFLTHLEIECKDSNEYLRWRAELIPFLAQTPTEGRDLLFLPPFISQLIYGTPQTRYMCQLAVKNILEQEFQARLREIEQARKVKE